MMNKKHPVFIGLIFLVFFLCAFTFEGPDFAKGWQRQNDFLISPSLYANVEETPVLKIVAGAERPAGSFWVYWRPRYQSRFDFSQSFERRVSGFRTYYFNFNDNLRWTRGVSQLLLRLSPDLEGFQIKEVSFVAENPWLAFLSRWQDFWSLPVVNVRRVNRVLAPGWGRINFMSLLYIFSAVFALVSLVFMGLKGFKRKISLKTFYLQATVTVIGVLLVAWMVLDLRFCFDYSREIYRHGRYLLFRGADFKRDLAYKGPVSDFVSFCRKELPSRSKICLKTPSEYQGLVLQYLLVPFYSVGLEDAAYVVGFGKPKQSFPGFNLYKEFGPQAWILKRRGER